MVHRTLLAQGVQFNRLQSGSAAARSIADWGPARHPVARVLAGYALDLGRLLDAKTALAMNALPREPKVSQELTHELPLLDHRGEHGGVALHYAFARVLFGAGGGPPARAATQLQLLDRYAVLRDAALPRTRVDMEALSEAGLMLREARLWTPTGSEVGGVDTRLAEAEGPLAALKTSLIAVALQQTKPSGGLVTLWYGLQLPSNRGPERARDRAGDLPLAANDVAPTAVTLRGGSILRYSTDTSGVAQGELTYFERN